MWIELAVLYYPDNYDPDDNVDVLGNKKKVKLTPGTMIINHNQICSFNEGANGTVIRMSDGDLIHSPVKYSCFKDLIDQIEARMELVISNEN